jgi:ferrous iron transport protein A
MSIATLDTLPLGQSARIIGIDWDHLHPDEARRLRELGLYEGVRIEALHRGSLFARDPLAVRIGRLRFVMRASHAAAIRVGDIDVAVGRAGDIGVPVETDPPA